MTPRTTIEKALERTRECFDIASAKLSHLGQLPRYEGIQLFKKSRTAGYVIPSKSNIVYLNQELLLQNEQNFLSTIIPHEVAHLFADRLNDKRGITEGPHGNAWKFVMRNVFKLAPIRCHNMQTDGIGKKIKKYRYICSCQKIDVGPKVHNKISCGAKYTCKKCKKSLVFLNDLCQP
jgi:SprT protein